MRTININTHSFFHKVYLKKIVSIENLSYDHRAVDGAPNTNRISQSMPI